jgi:hypothetical protein
LALTFIENFVDEFLALGERGARVGGEGTAWRGVLAHCEAIDGLMRPKRIFSLKRLCGRL